MGKSFHIRTYGCQMNERDSEAIACLLEKAGLHRVDGEEDADILLFNTCSVRDQAERKVLGKLGILKRLKQARPQLVMGIVGCMAQNHGADLLEQCAHLDLVVGTDRIHQLPEIIEAVLSGDRGLVRTQPGTEVLHVLKDHEPGHVSAYVAVMRGCNQFCSYCVVPYVRGREKSRDVENILDEIRGLVAQGTKEIFLLGQNVTAYGLAETREAGTYRSDSSAFADLLRAVHDVPGVRRIRFTSPHPRYMNQAFIDAICELPKVCKSFHMPLQSGSDRVLHLMRRGYSAADYTRIARQLRSRLPRVALSTDIIVGFPGETEEDFLDTRRLMTDIGFDMAYIFKYSPRPHTKAAEQLSDDVPQSVKEERNQILLADLAERATARNQACVGMDAEVLVEGPSKRNPARWSGRSDSNKVCIFDPAPDLASGDMVLVRITRATANALYEDVHRSD